MAPVGILEGDLASLTLAEDDATRRRVADDAKLACGVYSA